MFLEHENQNLLDFLIPGQEKEIMWVVRDSFDPPSKSPYTVSMRDWNLRPGDPLALKLSADHRLCPPDLRNDHAWEMEIGGGDPPALAVRTTYGLRARSMRIFPRFILNGNVFCHPEEFSTPPSLRFFAPNYLKMDYEPSPGLHVQAETWIPDPHTLAGRLAISNRTDEPCLLQVELCGQLVPMQGQGLRNVLIHSAQILSGRTADLAPVIFLTGGPTPAEGSLPGLALRLALASGGERSLTWVQAALGNQEESFEHARQTAARPWEAEIARVELVHQASIVDVYCGDPDWETAFALSQKQALSLFIQGLTGEAETSFLASRHPDQACPPLVTENSGFRERIPSDLECFYLGNALAGCPEMAIGLVRSQLGSAGNEVGPFQNGMPKNSILPLPLLAGMAREACQRSPGRNFQAELYPELEKFLERWLERTHDRDGDGLPECDFHPGESLDEPSRQAGKRKLQACLDGYFVENPALGAVLYHDFEALAGMAGELGMEERQRELLQRAENLREAVEECWDNHAGIYHRRDWLSHRSPAGSDLGTLKSSGTLDLGKSFPDPTRLVMMLSQPQEAGRGFRITLAGGNNEGKVTETFSREDLRWAHNTWQGTSRQLYSFIETMQTEGLEKNNRVVLQVMDFSRKDITQFLPIWAGIPVLNRVEKMLTKNLEEGKRFWGVFGIPYEPGFAYQTTGFHDGMILPFNAMLVEGLASYGRQVEAVRLMGGMMGAVVSNLKQHKAFFQDYDAKTGIGRGEHDAVQGLAPLGTFLKLLGVEFCPPGRVIIRGKNPFPWQVTVKYRGISVTRRMDRTEVTFPGGQNITLGDLTDTVVDAE